MPRDWSTQKQIQSRFTQEQAQLYRRLRQSLNTILMKSGAGLPPPQVKAVLEAFAGHMVRRVAITHKERALDPITGAPVGPAGQL